MKIELNTKSFCKLFLAWNYCLTSSIDIGISFLPNILELWNRKYPPV